MTIWWACITIIILLTFFTTTLRSTRKSLQTLLQNGSLNNELTRFETFCLSDWGYWTHILSILTILYCVFLLYQINLGHPEYIARYIDIPSLRDKGHQCLVKADDLVSRHIPVTSNENRVKDAEEDLLEDARRGGSDLRRGASDFLTGAGDFQKTLRRGAIDFRRGASDFQKTLRRGLRDFMQQS